MPHIFETRWFRRHWGLVVTEQSSKGHAHWATYEPNWKKIDEVMNALLAEIGRDEWEIKSVIPLTSSRTYVEGLINNHGMFQNTWGAGYGYGAPYAEGVVLICQRRVELTEAEYAEWRAAKEAKARQAAEEKAAAQRAEERKAAAKAIRDTPIENVSGGLFARARYRFDGVEYDDNAAAMAAREEKARQAEEGA
jgi:hypothetical protein